MSQIKSIFITILILVIIFFSGYYTNSYIDSKNTHNQKQKIDSVYVERLKFVHDTIWPKQKAAEKIYITETQYIDNTFKNGLDIDKINLFNKVYSQVDSNWLMLITNSQAEKALIRNQDAIRDSTLLEIEKQNSKNCDKTVTTIVKEVETIVEKKHNVTDVSLGLIGGIASILGLYFLLN